MRISAIVFISKMSTLSCCVLFYINFIYLLEWPNWPSIHTMLFRKLTWNSPKSKQCIESYECHKERPKESTWRAFATLDPHFGENRPMKINGCTRKKSDREAWNLWNEWTHLVIHLNIVGPTVSLLTALQRYFHISGEFWNIFFLWYSNLLISE